MGFITRFSSLTVDLLEALVRSVDIVTTPRRLSWGCLSFAENFASRELCGSSVRAQLSGPMPSRTADLTLGSLR